ncbi:phospholipid/cholesterol/gamma-HCH transport system substrate-binding protein [Rhodococcus erythropolis]|uniref:MlaD family protein n=2 Tax=Rhodococcus erythropolis TaxID=1833 RepID=UPI00216A209C|nr:MlaD family protein [Rhodococcus erythropolis]MCS4256009.1 phospholipid/cholesterol/gamma-HCH transport system substrate-binding protein [Rhodococcus erythropolis]
MSTVRAVSWFNSDLRIGVAVTAVGVIAVLLTAIVYINPMGRKTVSFETTDVSAISTGQDVRIAGISIGKVAKMHLGDQVVRVDLEVKDDAFIGDDSRVDVRMLTPVGGYAITIIPLGSEEASGLVIPSNHVSVPYSIGDVLQATPKVTDEVDAATVDANLSQVAEALGSNPGSIGSVISGITSIARVMDKQRDQVRTITTLSSEYLSSFNGNRDLIFNLVREMDIVFSTYATNAAGFNESYLLLGDLLIRLSSLELAYLNNKEEIVAAVNQVRTLIEEFSTSMGPAMDALAATRDQLAAWLSPEGLVSISGGTLMASDICLPAPGRQC